MHRRRVGAIRWAAEFDQCKVEIYDLFNISLILDESTSI
jgi:hypothetical protein